jgi:hypothetical protein
MGARTWSHHWPSDPYCIGQMTHIRSKTSRVAGGTARDLSGLAGQLAALKGDATHWLTDPAYAPLRHRLEVADASTLRKL